MIRRFNYTNRIRVLHEDVQIQLKQQDSKLAFEAKLELVDYDLPPDALVYVEAYRQTSWMRFDFGKVGAITPPKDCYLSEFDSADDVLFRVKITQGNESHVLLAEADKVPLRQPDKDRSDRIPLLPVKPHPLGDEIFRVDFSDDRPRLLINNTAGDWRAIAKAPAFVSLVYPSVFREVITRVVLIDEHDDSSDTTNWRALWLKLAESLPGVESCPSNSDSKEDRLDWVDTAVQAFAVRSKNLGKFGDFWKKEEE